MKSRVLIPILVFLVYFPASVIAQERPALIFDSSVPKNIKNRIENFTAIFINEISKAGKFSSVPSFPTGSISDSCRSKIINLWANNRFIIYPFETARVFSRYYGYEIKGIKIISLKSKGIIRGELIFSTEGVITDIKLYDNYIAPVIPVVYNNLKTIGNKTIHFIPITTSQLKDPVYSGRFNIDIYGGMRYLVENHSPGVICKVSGSYNTSPLFFIGTAVGFNIHKITFSDSFGNTSKNRSYTNLQLHAGINATKSLKLSVGYEKTFFEFSDNGAFVELSYKLKRICLNTSVIHFPKYGFTFPEISVGFSIF